MSASLVTIIACLILFFSTTIGSALVFLIRKELSAKVSNMILGFASGIMIAAGIFGLLIPAIEEAELFYEKLAFIPVVVGFLLGGLFLYLLDKMIPHFHIERDEDEGPKTNLTKQLKFFLAVLIHNIPEGLAVGFACGLALSTDEPLAIMSALSLAIGISIQNLPEGAAVSVPLYEQGMPRSKAFTYGMISGIVEPLFALVGILLSMQIQALMPWLLAFSAGAMIYVTIDELLPAARKDGHEHFGLWAFMFGFMVMLMLELLL